MLLGIYVAHIWSGRQRAEVKDDTCFLLTLVHQAVPDAYWDEQPLAGMYFVRCAIQPRYNRPAHHVDKLFRIGMVVFADLVAWRNSCHTHEAGGRSNCPGSQ